MHRVTFYQCGVELIEPEDFTSEAKANREAVAFLRSFTGALEHGHRYKGSVYLEGSAAIVDRTGATEARVTVERVTDG